MTDLPHYADLRKGHLVRKTLGRRWPSGWWIVPALVLGAVVWGGLADLLLRIVR